MDELSRIPPAAECRSTEDAPKMLRQLFAEVVEERRNEVLRAPLADQLGWYANEAVARVRYAERQAEKAERAKRKRK